MSELGFDPELVQNILGDERTIALLITLGCGLLAGKIIRSLAKIFIYFLGVFALILISLQYFGLISIVLNYQGFKEIFEIVFFHTQKIGIAEHLFFWVPFLYGLKRSRVLPVH